MMVQRILVFLLVLGLSPYAAADGGPDPVRDELKTKSGMGFRYYRATFEQLRDREFCAPSAQTLAGIGTDLQQEAARRAAGCQVLQDTKVRHRERRLKVWAWPVEQALHPAMYEDGYTYFGTACICTEAMLPACNAVLPKRYNDPLIARIVTGERGYQNVLCNEVTWDAETVLYYVE